MRNNSRLSDLLNLAASDITEWGGVLDFLTKECGAEKGLITLRSRDSAELIIPSGVERLLSSPLISGFSKGEVESYLEEFIFHDPWTEIEAKWHPYYAYSLSDHLPKKALYQTKFWPWLEAQKLDDTLVYALQTSGHEWVALNFYFDDPHGGLVKSACGYLNEIGQQLRKSWLAAEDFFKFRNGFKVDPVHLSDCDIPAALLDKNFVVSSINEIGKEKLHKNLGQAKALTIGINVIIPQAIRFSAGQPKQALIGHWSGATPNSRLSLFMKKKEEDLLGRENIAYLLTSGKETDLPFGLDVPIWTYPKFTKRDREIIQWRAEGHLVKKYAEKKNISEETAQARLKEACKKLGGVRSRDIETIHRIYLQNTSSTGDY